MDRIEAIHQIYVTFSEIGAFEMLGVRGWGVSPLFVLEVISSNVNILSARELGVSSLEGFIALEKVFLESNDVLGEMLRFFELFN